MTAVCIVASKFPSRTFYTKFRERVTYVKMLSWDNLHVANINAKTCKFLHI